ncbi:hypothetical protein K4A83_05770 [Spirulina subsalsa FACHB-351]|uniref:Uncharacterized protein n=1 Tax=Spirulina subsalsa FACHB-351 TaxID=234711 RepID=A0ABT3L2P7_9CYAN|nr:hypothetical protein [Spirulina subsalsa]MCW6035781.1 hypothetical protein [Spirulina subsalsa FACHB-351]
MSRPTERLITYLFFISLGVTIGIYLLRGFALPPFTSLPGGILWILLLLSLGSGILYGIEKTRRF